jgi:hypothetical protein
MPTKRKTRGRNQRVWFRVYRARIEQYQEYCRRCKIVAADLTFDHVQPYSRGGTPTFDNTTILCPPCNQLKADSAWPDLRSLAEEEAAAPPDRRWARIESERILAAQIAEAHEEALHVEGVAVMDAAWELE